MRNDLGLKLIAITDSTKLMLYEAQEIKITQGPNELQLSLEKHLRPEKRQALYQKKSTPASLFQPKNSPEELEHQDAATKIANHLELTVREQPNYKELIIAAEPKMLGYIRQYLSNNLKKIITKEITKDLTNKNIAIIEQTVFA